MMPDPEKQRAQNEAKLFAEGIRVPFYELNSDGGYVVDGDNLPVLDHTTAAIPFELPAAGGGSFVYTPDESSGHLLIYVIPTTSGPNTLQQLNKLSGYVEDLRSAGIETVGVSCESLESLAGVNLDLKLNLSLLADADREFTTAYGCNTADMEFPQRTMIGLGPGGSVVFYSRGFAYATTAAIKKAFGLAD